MLGQNRRRRFERRKPGKKVRQRFQRVRTLTDKRLLADDSRKTIERFVKQNATGKTFLENLQSLSDKIQAFQAKEGNLETVKQLWCNRSAVEIISQKSLVEIDLTEKYNVEGCTDIATALLASARTLARLQGVKAEILFVRWKAHTGVRVKFGVQDWLFKGGEAIQIKDRFLKKIETDKRENQYAEGFGPRAIGLNSLADFHRYSGKQRDK